MSQANKSHPRGTMSPEVVVGVEQLLVEVSVWAPDLIGRELQQCEQKTFHAAHRAAADYIKGVLAARKLGPTLPEAV